MGFQPTEKTLSKKLCLFGVWFCFCFFPCLAGVEGEVFLENEKSFSGLISINRNIRFKDIFRDQVFNFRLEDIAQIELKEESTRPVILLQAKRAEDKLVKYMVIITTWKGKKYWGRKSFNLTVYNDNNMGERRKKRFVLPKTQKLSLRTLERVKKVIFRSSTYGFPNLDRILSLSGKVSIAAAKKKNLFQKVYALHRDLPLVFSGEVKENRYLIRNLVPGKYDLFFVGDTAIVFFLSPTKRKAILDKPTLYAKNSLSNWVKSRSEVKLSRRLFHFSGHYSNTRAMVLEGESQVSLWVCNLQSRQWYLENSYILYKSKDKGKQPALLFDPRLGFPTLKTNSKQVRYDYVVK